MVKAILSPLLIFLLFLVIKDVIMALRWRLLNKAGRILLIIGFLMTLNLYILSVPIFAHFFANQIERPYVISDKPISTIIDGVVILGGGLHKNKIMDKYNLNFRTQLRVREGVRFFKEVDARLLVMSGKSDGKYPDRMVGLMKEMAIQLGVPEHKIILESYSRNTYEHPIGLMNLGIVSSQDTIAIATSAWHLPRAMKEFKKYFFHSIAIPTDFYGNTTSRGLLDWMPSVSSLSKTTELIHEKIGSIWYGLRAEMRKLSFLR